MTTILITGVGGGVGQSLLKALAGGDDRLIAVDGDPLASGLYWEGVAHRAVIPYASDPAYLPILLSICRRERVDLLFPGLDAELLPLARAREAFAAQGTRAMVSEPRVIELADDKLQTARFVEALGLCAPATNPLLEVYDYPGPCVLKPQRGGARSRQTFICQTRADFYAALPHVDPENCVIQEYIEGPEYTCGTVTLGGEVYGPILMRRILRDGDTYKAFPEEHPRLAALVRELMTALQPTGACNVQFRLYQGQPYILEINARSSGTTAARARCGFNEPRMCVNYYLHQQRPNPRIRTDRSILRFWQETFVPNDRILPAANFEDRLL